jgi:cellulose synthase/poly-beta-1,6-N-acetylglucosamine synthase-like glycosyltransferase
LCGFMLEDVVVIWVLSVECDFIYYKISRHMLIDIFVYISCFMVFVVFLKTLDLYFNTPKIIPYDLDCSDGVDLLIPVRDEADRGLEKNIVSVVSNIDKNVRVIAINDRSSDGSGEIINSVARKFCSDLICIDGIDTPPGWLGKIFALEQGKQMGDNKWIAFLDADVFLQKKLIHVALDFAVINNYDALCVLPEFTYGPFWVGVLMPTMLWLSGLRVSPTQTNSQYSTSAFGFGNFILVKRDAHDDIGGFESYRSSVLDDCEVMERLKDKGYKVYVADGGLYFKSPMYSGLKEMYYGFKKNSFAAIGYSWYRLFMFIAFETVCLFVPMIYLFSGRCLLMLLTLFMLLSVVLIGLRVKAPFRYYILFPVSHFIAVFIMLSSALSRMTNKGTRWKGRRVD